MLLLLRVFENPFGCAVAKTERQPKANTMTLNILKVCNNKNNPISDDSAKKIDCRNKTSHTNIISTKPSTLDFVYRHRDSMPLVRYVMHSNEAISAG